MGTLQGRVAVVTGASSGIGKAIALALAAGGARLCLVGRQLDSLQHVAQAAGSGTARCIQADLAVQADVDRLLLSIQQDAASVDVLVHAAGVFAAGSFEHATIQQLDAQYAVNVRAPYVLTKGLLPALRSQQGQVVFLNSTAGLAARASAGQYAASKHALKALADSLREEVNPAGVRVLSLYLGRTATPMQSAVHAAEGRPYRPELLVQPDDVAALVVHALACPRSMEITEIALRPMVKSY